MFKRPDFLLLVVIALSGCGLDRSGVSLEEAAPDSGLPPGEGPATDSGPLPAECSERSVDTDGDGSPDCLDRCPRDEHKREPGACGCEKPDEDSDKDEDGQLDCNDSCPSDPEKFKPGVCGCGTSDADTDKDGILDCSESCVDSPGTEGAAQCPCILVDGACQNMPPTVTLIQPTSTTVAHGQFGVQAAATDSDGSIVSVALYINGEPVREEKSDPYRWGVLTDYRRAELNRYAPGEYQLEVVASDDDGATARASLQITLTE